VLDHVTIRVSDRRASERFYEMVLATLGAAPGHRGAEYTMWRGFVLAQADESRPPTRRLHVGFTAPSREEVDEFWRAGTAAGYRDDGPPGPRPQYTEDYYGAFLLDPDGNSAEAVHHAGMRGALIDHLWIRVADLAAARRFYELVAPHSGFELASDTAERAQFAGPNGSFSLLAGEPTENLHMAFAASSNAAVDAFHGTVVAAGYRDNGPPGERAVYHPGYYGAFVLDPDANNIELVNHNR
jgi:catechol 2,3-dioxygenase-like lactoylglutathione lyase family enzyme